MRFDSVKVILFMLVILVVLSGAASASEQSAGGAAAVRAELSKLPLSFIPNNGQADPAVLFQAKAEGHTIFFTQDDVVLVADKDGIPVIFSTTVAGANPAATVLGVDPLPGTASFFIGNNQADWKSGIPTFGGVEYKNILPGIDLTYRGNMGVLKREFVVAPGADASGIVIVYDAVDGIIYGPDGTLEVQTPVGVLIETAPVCYQVIDGNKVNVPAQYNILGDGRVGFSFGSYDPAYPLVIDPTLVYSSYLGGVKNDAAMGIAVDNLGYAYVTGYTESYNFPVISPILNPWISDNLNGTCSDVFVTKVSPDGKEVLYSTYLGGNNTDGGNGIAVNDTYVAFVTGFTTSLGFPVVNGNPKNANMSSTSPCPFPGCPGQADAFVSAISIDGSELIYSTCFGGNSTDVSTSVAIYPNADTEGDTYIYTTGYTNSDNFLVTGSPEYQQPFNNGASLVACDAFVTELAFGDPTPVFSSYLGGSSNDQGFGIILNLTNVTPSSTDYYNTVYVTGWTESPDFPTLHPFMTSNQGQKDGFVSKFLQDGAATNTFALNYSTYLGGNGNDEGHGIAVKNIGGKEYAHVTGVTYSTNFPITSPPFIPKSSGVAQFGDAFITKLNPTGQTPNWSTYFGGNGNDAANGIALDMYNNILITGYTNSYDFPVKNAIPTFATKQPFQDAFVSMVNANRSSLNFSTYLGGNLDDVGTGIAVRNSGDIFVSGYTTSWDFPTSLNYPDINSFEIYGIYYGNQYPGWINGFVTKISNAPAPEKPVAKFNFSYSNSSGCLPVYVSFHDQSTGVPSTWLWNFGDGGTSDLQNPVHPYYNAGPYYVTLIVTNALGTSDPYTGGPIVITIPASPKFTDANSTTAIGEIHVAQNGTRKVSLFLNATPEGLAGYNMTLSFRNTSSITPPYVPDTVIANITDVSRPGWVPEDVKYFTWSNLTFDSHNVTFQGIAIPAKQYDPLNPNVRLANFTIMGNQLGNSTLHINSTNMMTNAFGFNMSLCPPDYNLTVYVERLQPIPGTITPYKLPETPQDPNGDGLYEDVNGVNGVNMLDVIDFANYLWWITNFGQPIDDSTNEYQRFFDFDRNGVVNFYDVITLYYSIEPVI
jgi:PKD repeat protein